MTVKSKSRKIFKQGSFRRVGIITLVLAVFSFATLTLVSTPSIVSLAESKLTAANLNQETKLPLSPEVAGVSTKAYFEVVDGKTPAPFFTSNAVFAQDLTTGTILYQKNINNRLSPASTTKLMTALVAQEYFKPADILTVTPEAMVGGSSMDLNVGEKLTFRSLLYGMLLNSGNDASFAIASNYPGGLGAFVAKMNEKVDELGLKNTHFQNPAGFDAPNHYSSAFDLAVIAQEAIKVPQLQRIVATKETSILSWDKSHEHNLKNLNKLLAEEGVLGIKTGFTPNAGENFVGLVDRQNHKVITVVLNSQDRFGETKDLMNWVYQNYSWREVNEKSSVVSLQSSD